MPSTPPPGITLSQPNGGASLNFTLLSGYNLPVAPPTGWKFTLTCGTTSYIGMNGGWSSNPDAATPGPQFVTTAGSTSAATWSLVATCNGAAATCAWDAGNNTAKFTSGNQTCAIILSAAAGGTMGACSATSDATALKIVNTPASGDNPPNATLVAAPGWYVGCAGMQGSFGANFTWVGGNPINIFNQMSLAPGNWTFNAGLNGVAATACTWSGTNTNGAVTFTVGSQSYTIPIWISSGNSQSLNPTPGTGRFAGTLSITVDSGSAALVGPPTSWQFYLSPATPTSTTTAYNTWSNTWYGVTNGVTTSRPPGSDLPVAPGSWVLTAVFNGVQQGIAMPTWQGTFGTITIGIGTNAITTIIDCSSGG